MRLGTQYSIICSDYVSLLSDDDDGGGDSLLPPPMSPLTPQDERPVFVMIVAI